MRFSEVGLAPDILRALEDIGYKDLTPVQEQTLPHILAGRDVLAKAETGSGKTGACAIPIVQRADPDLDEVQTLILVPTRELAQQYVAEINDIAKYTKVVPFAVYGGFSMEIQKAKLDHGVHVLVATPGRLIDFLYNTPLSLSHVKTFVLDETDEMMNMGFIDDVRFVLRCLVHEHQTLFFSATMPDSIEKLARECLTDPVHIDLNRDQVAPQSLAHHFDHVDHRARGERLLDYFEREDIGQAIIFCNTRNGSEKLYGELRRHLDSVEIIHGGLDQGKRTSIFRRFKDGQIKFMIATDLAGRGLDFSKVTHVINYDFPQNAETYTHRTGRTGRMGRHGTAVTFVTARELGQLRDLISSNRFQPNWLGKAPDLSATHSKAHRGKSGGYGGGRGRGRARGRR